MVFGAVMLVIAMASLTMAAIEVVVGGEPISFILLSLWAVAVGYFHERLEELEKKLEGLG